MLHEHAQRRPLERFGIGAEPEGAGQEDIYCRCPVAFETVGKGCCMIAFAVEAIYGKRRQPVGDV